MRNAAFLLLFAAMPVFGQSCNSSADGYTSCYDPMTGARATGWNDGGDVHVRDQGGNTYRGYTDGSRLTNTETGASSPVHMWSDPAPARAVEDEPRHTESRADYSENYSEPVTAAPETRYEAIAAPEHHATYTEMNARAGLPQPLYGQAQPSQSFSYAATTPVYAVPQHEAPTVIFYDGTKDAQKPKSRKPRCDFQAVMSDEEMAACR